MKSSIKVMHILLGERIAGAENHLIMLLPELVKKGINVSLLNLSIKELNNISPDYENKLNELKNYGVNVHRQVIRNKFDLIAIKEISETIKNINPDIVHTHMMYADLFAACAAKVAKVPVVISTRHYDYTFSKKEIIKTLPYLTIANLFHNYLIPVSNNIAHLCKHYEKFPQMNIFPILHGYIDNKVDKSFSRNKIKAELKINNDTLIVGTVSRLIRLKGYSYAIEAAKKLKESEINFKWLFVGDGPDKEILLKKVNESNLSDNILFLGFRKDIPQIMAALDILVHPSLAEAFGLVILEAMIQSTPVISSNIGAIPEIIVNKESGILVEPKNVLDLYLSLVALIDDSNYRKLIGDNGRKRFDKYFTLKRMVSELNEVYIKLIKNSFN